MISRNMSTIFEQARSHGTPLVLAHRSYGQLKDVFEVDMTQNVDANCVASIDLGTPDPFAMKRYRGALPTGALRDSFLAAARRGHRRPE